MRKVGRLIKQTVATKVDMRFELKYATWMPEPVRQKLAELVRQWRAFSPLLFIQMFPWIASRTTQQTWRISLYVRSHTITKDELG
jgi:hypothetical protein